MMRFLRQLYAAFKGFKFQAKPSALSDNVGEEELLTRYIYETGKFSVQKLMAKKGAFMPEFYRGQFETSVCRTFCLTEDQIWDIGNAARQDGVAVKARADFVVANLTAAQLKAKAAPGIDSYPQHAVIVGWPNEKHEQLMRATELANAASLVIPEK